VAATPKYYPVKEGDSGSHVQGYGRAMARHSGKLKQWNALPARTKRTWGWWHRRAANKIRAELGLPASGLYGPKLHKLLVEEPAFDAKATALVNSYVPPRPVPDLGPVWKGGKSVLDHDLTHATGGIKYFPAFDDAFVQGREIVAPEDIEVYQESSSRPGLAFYAKGKSRIRYWFGHLDRTHKAGTRFEKGETVGRVAANSIGGGPHVHVGVNVELLFGPGKQLAHHTNYTHGAPTVGAQLEKAL
jgi:hypothetical protein